MSGAKRRTKYRKHVESDILEGLPEPGENERIVQVVASRGGNMLEVVSETGDEGLCQLPGKFRKLVWIKRGSFAIATHSAEAYETAAGREGKVKYTVTHILFKDQIKHLQKVGRWPDAAFPNPLQGSEQKAKALASADALAEAEAAAAEAEAGSGALGEQDGSEQEEEGEAEADLFVNRNRQSAAAMMDDSESDSSSDEG